MPTNPSADASEPRATAEFATTHWSVVLAAGDSNSPAAAESLEALCRTYWFPLYAYVRRRGYRPEEAQDLTQEFFARLLARKAFEHLTREGGKFRSFLLKALNRFLVNEWERHQAQKRDERKIAFSLDGLDPESRYRFEPAEEMSPELLFDRKWAATLLDQAMNRLRGEYAAEGKAELFQRLQPCLTGAQCTLPYAALARQSGVSEGAVKMAVQRLRRRYGELLRAEVAHTVSSPHEVAEEIRGLIGVLAK